MARTTAGLDSNLVSDSGGSEEIILDAGGLGQGADQPCRKVYITQPYSNTAGTRVNVGIAAAVDLGVEIPLGSSATATGPQQPGPMEINIANTNLLHFFGATTETISIMYLK